ncbi:sensor histidine kinase [Citreimonas salinaria]|uniref:histidine kinase n=1 Tax=Citreimonas salinaria TaxID=321339 RepID=A0A1H3NU01_9RHOB|nr:histidine kinase dimerization/phosphoacceptor domain -containing protein [Citreimonas salinaria]SDY92288.1 Two-component sensor histidine kinase, contains HisKA and HATPase domains [Citreimonas salinaria]
MPNLEQMRARQKMLADFGHFALRSDDLDEVLHEACRLVSDALDTDLAKILEIEEGGKAALVKAGVGWQEEITGKRLPFSDRSSETYALKHGEPVVSRNVREETRFEFADFLIDNGVVSLVNVPIFLPAGKAYGLLQVDSREQRDFGDDDIEFLRTYAIILGPVVDRLHKTHSLKQALQANERLLRELQHRVKNHIGIITSMVRVRARHARSEEAREELGGVGERIETLRLVHEQLYKAGGADMLPMRPFLSQLVGNLCRLHESEAGGIRFECDIANVDLGPDAAVPMGLIANEFVTNSLKHAFDGEGGTIFVSLATVEDRLRLCLSDNGKGLPADPHAAPRGSGTGIRLIEGLASQFGAEPSWSSSESGTKLCLDMDDACDRDAI